MAHCVYASPGVPEQFQQVFLGQPKRHEDESKWEELFHRKLAAYWHKVFFHWRLGGQGETKYSVLPNASYDR